MTSNFCVVLPEEIVEDMWRTHVSAKDFDQELGFALCDVNGKILRGSICEGDECRIPGEKIEFCLVGKTIGFFHSHIDSEPVPSLQDLEYGYSTGIRFECIAGLGDWDEEIVCYDLSVAKDELERIDKILDEIENIRDKYGIRSPMDILSMGFERYLKYKEEVEPLEHELDRVYERALGKLIAEGSCEI